MQRRGVELFVVMLFRSSLVALVASSAFDCSGDDGHAPFASDDCVGVYCGRRGSFSGISTGGSAASRVDAAVVSTGGTSGGLGCAVDPASGLTLCRTLADCPGFELDVNSFPGCGLSSQPQGLELDCLCNGTQVCPLGFAATCNDLPRLFSSSTVTTELCSQAITQGTCRDVAAGSSVSATCDRNCAAGCGSSPTCLRTCGC